MTKLLSSYVRRGPNTEALKTALFKPLSLVLARKKLELEVEPSLVYKSMIDDLRFKIDADLPTDVTSAKAWEYKQVRDTVLPRVKNLLDVAELFLTRIVAARGLLPYGVRALAQKVFNMAQVK